MKITDNYEIKVISDELLLVPKPNSGLTNALVLNKLASEIYKLIEAGYAENKISRMLFDKYEVDEAILTKDIQNVKDMFLNHGVVSD